MEQHISFETTKYFTSLDTEVLPPELSDSDGILCLFSFQTISRLI